MDLDLSIDGTPLNHSIPLPAKCEPEGVCAKWSKKNKTLTVTLPLLVSQNKKAVARLGNLAMPSGAPDDVHATTAAELEVKLRAADAASKVAGRTSQQPPFASICYAYVLSVMELIA